MKHGPIALVDETLPVVFICNPEMLHHQKVVSNMQENKSQKGKSDCRGYWRRWQHNSFMWWCDHCSWADEIVAPMLSVIPLQLLAYYIGIAKEYDVDKPRTWQRVSRWNKTPLSPPERGTLIEYFCYIANELKYWLYFGHQFLSKLLSLHLSVKFLFNSSSKMS